MTVTFFSNFLNHHQLPLCKEFIKQIGEENFHFVSSERIHEERTKMGYDDMNLKYPFVIRAYESQEQMGIALKLAHESDVAIIGSALAEFHSIRKRLDKLTFLYRERLFKNGTWHRFYPPTALKLIRDYTSCRNKDFYLLGASAYAASDVQLCGFKADRCLKWGYFPELLSKVEKSFDKLRIMWCGRMLGWKHPEDAIEVGRLLHERGIDFDMKIIGNGEKRSVVEKMIDDYNLRSQISTYDFMTPVEIRKVMNDSNVYLFTSGKQEGWGVVLNEAMNSGCVVIANRNAGSAPYLIDDKVNGLLYDGNLSSLTNAVDSLLDFDMKKISACAYHTIKEVWAPEIAAKNLIEFSKSRTPMCIGPCSLA